jgi:hypothetical protein
MDFPFKFFHQNFIRIYFLPCVDHARPSNPTYSDLLNNILLGLQVMKLLIIQFSLSSRRFLSYRPRDSSEQPIVTYSQSKNSSILKVESQPTFQRNVSPPFSASKNSSSKKPA